MVEIVSSQLVLSSVQLKVVDAPLGRLVFIGTPGSGKSTVIVERAIKLVRSGVAEPDALLLLAPSRRAAVAIGNSVNDRLGNGSGITATSFHGLAMAILRRHYKDAGYLRPPQLLDTARHFQFLQEVLAQEDPRLWPHYRGQLQSSTLRVLVHRTIMGMAENGLNPAELRRRVRAWGQVDMEDVVAFVAGYRERLRLAGVIDFGCLLTTVAELLSTNKSVAGIYHRAYRHILVDEFEQANFAQMAIVSHLVGEGTDLLVAGDPAQATNSFRGGTPSHLLGYSRRIDARVVFSSEDHRCRRRIASVGVAIRPVEYSASLWERTQDEEQDGGPSRTGGSDREPGYAVLRQFTHPSQEARWIGSEIESLLQSGIQPTQIAILFRSLATPVAKLIAKELGRRKLPVQGEGGQTVGGDPLVRGAIAVLRYIYATGRTTAPDPDDASAVVEAFREEALSEPGAETGDEGLFLRVLDSPISGLPPFGLQELRRAVALAGRELNRLEWDGLEGLALRAELRAALVTFFDCLATLRRVSTRSASSLLWEAWRLFPAFREDALSGGQSSVAYAALMSEVESVEEEKGYLSLDSFISLVDSGLFDQLWSFARSKKGLTVTTVHQAKGREWDVVFLPALVEGVLPSQSPSLDIRPLVASDREPDTNLDAAEAAARMSALCYADHVAEEQRVFYVAISRARRGLYLSYSQRDADGQMPRLPSRFLAKVLDNPEVEVMPSNTDEQLPAGIEDTVVHYRRALRSEDPLLQAQALYGLQEMRKRWREAVRPEMWWTNVAESSGAAPPYPDGRLYLSASRLGTYRSCPLSYQFGYHWCLGETEGPALTIGSVLHAVLEDYHGPESTLPRTREALEERLDYHFDESKFRYRPIAKQARKVLSEMLDRYYSRYGQSNSVVAVEIGFGFDFGPHRITGYIDRVDHLPNGRLELIDYKTGQAMSKADAENDLQLALYDLAFFHDDKLRALGQPGRASYLYLKGIGPRADGKRSYVPNDESRKRLSARVSYYSDAILAERFPPHRALSDIIPPSDQEELERALRRNPCRICPFVWICPETEREGSDE